MPIRRALLQNLAVIAVLGAAPSHAIASDAQAALPARLPLLQPLVVEYRWTFLTPHWDLEPREVGARVYAPRLRATRVDYGVVEVETRRRMLGWVAEFGCKYSDFGLPNECRTTWREVYVDVPVPVIRRDYIDVDVPEWSWQRWRTTVDVPRLVWKEETLVVSLPAVAVTVAPPP